MIRKTKLFLILVLFLLFGRQALAQVNVVFRDTLINQIDSNGIKNGLWIDFTNPTNLHISFIKSRGYYKDNKKTGVWYYYYDTDYNGLSETVEYHSDGSITIIGRDKILINKDSSEIHYYEGQNRTVTCLKTKDGNYNCTRKYIDIKKEESIIFKNFDECMDNWNTKWAVPTVSNGKEKSNGQDCKCKTLFESYDSVELMPTLSIPEGFYYINDTVLVVKYPTQVTRGKFSFEDFEKEERLRKDTFIIRNGELLQNILDTQVVVYSPRYFKGKKATYQYSFANRSNIGYLEIAKTKFQPIRKEKVKGKTYYKYLKQVYSYVIASKDINADSLKQNMFTIPDEQFGKVEHFSDDYFYFSPGRGFLLDFCYEDLPFHLVLKYKDTPGCEEFIKRQFKSWE